MQPQRRTTVFVSYCHKNRRWLDRLRVHLTPYDRRGDLDLWDDTKIAPGDRWSSSIGDAIDRAAASIVLISADFLASDFVAVHELPKLLHKAERAGARILPIFVEPCDLANHPELASFQALNSPKKPLAETSRVDAERVLVRAVEAIATILSGDSAERTAVSGGAGKTSRAATQHIFDELELATVMLSVLWALRSANSNHTLSELEEKLRFRSRRKAHEAVTRLLTHEWIAKERMSRLTRYHLTEEGGRQLQRLADASDGPVRRSIAAR
jgi:hypothetical protein